MSKANLMTTGHTIDKNHLESTLEWWSVHDSISAIDGILLLVGICPFDHKALINPNSEWTLDERKSSVLEIRHIGGDLITKNMLSDPSSWDHIPTANELERIFDFENGSLSTNQKQEWQIAFDPFLADFNALMTLWESKTTHPIETPLEYFVNWAKSKGYPCIWEETYSKNVAKNEKIKPLGSLEKNTLLKIIGGLAMSGYKMEIHTSRFEKLEGMLRALADQGVEIDPGTLRKHLTAAAELIPPKPKLHKPN